MSDRELLELAARATNMQLGIWQDEKLGFELPFCGNWNPLTDDGDALRLAVKRKIFRCHMDLFHRFYEEEIANGFEDNEATRRAIVRAVIRAAAELGRNIAKGDGGGV